MAKKMIGLNEFLRQYGMELGRRDRKGVSDASMILLSARTMMWVRGLYDPFRSYDTATKLFALLHAAKRWHEEP